MSDGNSLIGYIVQWGSLDGVISEPEELTGYLSPTNSSLIGELSYASGSSIEEYMGPYVATPTLEVQILETKEKKMLDDVTVNATPLSDVRTVDTDGYTITVL